MDLIDLVDKGTFTPLPNEIRKMKRELDKRAITHGQVDNLIVLLSKKYSASTDSEDNNSNREIEVNITPDIVITETFV